VALTTAEAVLVQTIDNLVACQSDLAMSNIPESRGCFAKR